MRRKEIAAYFSFSNYEWCITNHFVEASYEIQI